MALEVPMTLWEPSDHNRNGGIYLQIAGLTQMQAAQMDLTCAALHMTDVLSI